MNSEKKRVIHHFHFREEIGVSLQLREEELSTVNSQSNGTHSTVAKVEIFVDTARVRLLLRRSGTTECRTFQVELQMNRLLSRKDIIHHEKSEISSFVRLHSEEAEDLREKSIRVLHDVAVVMRQHLTKSVRFVFAECLDDVLHVLAEVEERAALSRGLQLRECVVSTERDHEVSSVDSKLLTKVTKHHRTVLFEFEVRMIMRRSVCTSLLWKPHVGDSSEVSEQQLSSAKWCDLSN